MQLLKQLLIMCTLVGFVETSGKSEEFDQKNFLGSAWQVSEVGYSGGELTQLTTKTWQERYHPKLKGINFNEVTRDEWSVYLIALGGVNIKIEVDLWTKQVTVNGSGFGPTQAFNLSFHRKTNGPMARWIRLNNGGQFMQENHTRWIELNSQGQKIHEFTETARDTWSVYLNDNNRTNVSIILNLWTNKVLISFPGSNGYQDLYDIQDSKKINGWMADQAHFSSGLFRQPISGTWVRAAGGSTYFDEEGRDPWSVYLVSRRDGERIQLDFWTMEVRGSGSVITNILY